MAYFCFKAACQEALWLNYQLCIWMSGSWNLHSWYVWISFGFSYHQLVLYYGVQKGWLKIFFTSFHLKKFHRFHTTCVIRWLIGCNSFVSTYICLISILCLGKQRQAAMTPLLSFLCVGFSPSLHSTLDYILWANEPRWKVVLEVPTIPAAYGHMPTLHLSHHPSFHLILNQTPSPSYLHSLILEEGSKWDSNSN